MAKLYFKYGAMGSSKTATALITKYNYEERGMKVWLIKPAADSRDGQFTLKSRIGLSSECEAISADKDIRTLYHAREKADVIIVDECQFIPSAATSCRRRRSTSCASWWTGRICRCCASAYGRISRRSCFPEVCGFSSWPTPLPRSKPSATADERPRPMPASVRRAMW